MFSSLEENNPNCYGNGKYCFADPDGYGAATGKDIADEVIR